jgi:hypothetical protein
VQSAQIFLRKNKEKQSIAQFKSIEAIKSSQNFSESFQNFSKSFENISLSEKSRDEISKVILLKLKNHHSEAFKDHRKSSHSIISFSFNEVEMIDQHSDRTDQNMQEMIQAIIRDMMSEIIQQSVTTAVNVIATTVESDSTFASKHSQMIFKTTSKSRANR